MFRAGLATVSALFLALAAGSAQAQDVTLKGVSSFPEGTLFSSKFEAFVKEVNAKGAAVKVRIQYLGGAPKVMPTFDVGKNLKDGVFDILSSASAYYTNVLPEADALKLIENSIQVLRRNGGWEYINKLHNEKMNAYYLARLTEHDVFHIYLNKEITKPDFTGLRIRVTPAFRPMAEKLGATAISSPPTELYTMLERNTVDGYGWPTRGIFDFSWQKVTKYRIEPGFYNADIHLLVNLAVWRTKLNDAQRAFLQETAFAIEARSEDDKMANDAERKRQEAAGMKAIRFSPEDEKKYLAVARDSGWESILKQSPEHGPKLREFFVKKD
jgi:TRAP-type C4-dicarboxylate transport system substrate-binding protein